MKLMITNLLFLSITLCSSHARNNLRGVPSNIFSNISCFLNEAEQNALSTLTSKDVNHRCIIHAIQTAKDHFSRAESLQIFRSPDLRGRIIVKYGNLSIYPITLTFHQDDLPSLKELDVFSFINRIQTVVIKGTEIERLVIQAKDSESGAAVVPNKDIQWDIGMYDRNAPSWAWSQPIALMDVLHSDTVTAVKKLYLAENYANVVIELTWSVSAGDMHWTVTKTSRLEHAERRGISYQDILLNEKVSNLQTLLLTEFDRAVLDDVSVLAQLTNLESVNLSALAQLTTLKKLNLRPLHFDVLNLDLD